MEVVGISGGSKTAQSGVDVGGSNGAGGFKFGSQGGGENGIKSIWGQFAMGNPVNECCSWWNMLWVML